MPEELRAQVSLLHDWIRATGLPLVIEPDVEADDVIGTLARQAAPDQQVLIVTGDKDMAHLVSPRVRLIDTMKGVETDMAGVEERFGVPPERIADLLALDRRQGGQHSRRARRRTENSRPVADAIW
jgi:5''-3'' exonuclease (including N-terminal domain of PolI)